MNLEGKHILVVGGTSGLGASAAKAFIQRGAQVAVSGRDPAKLESATSWLGTRGVAVGARRRWLPRPDRRAASPPRARVRRQALRRARRCLFEGRHGSLAGGEAQSALACGVGSRLGK